MQSGDLFNQQFLQMRERCLSLAADMDRLARAAGGMEAISADPRMRALHKALQVVLDDKPEHARRVLESFSDQSSPAVR